MLKTKDIEIIRLTADSDDLQFMTATYIFLFDCSINHFIHNDFIYCDFMRNDFIYCVFIRNDFIYFFLRCVGLTEDVLYPLKPPSSQATSSHPGKERS